MYIKVLLFAFITMQCNCFAEPLILMTFNIRYDNLKDGENRWELRREHVAKVIKEQQKQIEDLQEHTHEPQNYKKKCDEMEERIIELEKKLEEL